MLLFGEMVGQHCCIEYGLYSSLLWDLPFACACYMKPAIFIGHYIGLLFPLFFFGEMVSQHCCIVLLLVAPNNNNLEDFLQNRLIFSI